MSTVGLGAWFLDNSAWPSIDTGHAKAVIRRAWDRGFRHFDTAESYGNGRSEQIIGQALRSELRQRRDEIHVATKSVVRPPDALRSHLVRSLRRMQLDFVDTFYIHWPRDGIDLAAAVEALAHEKERGRVRRIGLCNVSKEEVRITHGRVPVDTVQFGYNLIWRKPETQQLTTLPQRRIAYSVLAQGLLARSFPYQPQWDVSDHRPRTPLFRWPVWDAVHAFQQQFVAECRSYGFTPAAVAIAWAIDRVDGVLAGARSIDQLDALADGLETIRARPTELNQLMSSITPLSTTLQQNLPDLPNMFGYVPTPCRSC